MYSHVQPYRPIAHWLHTVCDLIYCGNGHRLGGAAWAQRQPHHTLKTNSQEEEFDVLP
jgi:hypothetical protein